MSNENVCQDQQTFNQAFMKAQMAAQTNGASVIAFIIWLIFFIWGMQLIDNSIMEPAQRTEHVFFCFLASPLYVLCWYLGNWNN